MKIASALVTKASGSIGGMTGSHNRGGMYLRARTTPSNPSSPAQQAVRANLGGLVALWTQTLTTPQRDAWNAYALANPIVDSLGASRNIGGLGWYIRSNGARIQAGITRVDAAPVINGPVALTPPTIASITPPTTATIAFNNADAWATTVGGALLIYVGRPQSATINSFKGPFRFTDKVLGAVSPPTSPKTIVLPFPVATGQRLFARLLAVSADGRVSTDNVVFRVA